MICLEQKSLHNVSKSKVLSLVALLSRDCNAAAVAAMVD
jgi:hypothetical protein